MLGMAEGLTEGEALGTGVGDLLGNGRDAVRADLDTLRPDMSERTLLLALLLAPARGRATSRCSSSFAKPASSAITDLD